jgi:S1-C subfamily serine protease
VIGGLVATIIISAGAGDLEGVGGGSGDGSGGVTFREVEAPPPGELEGADGGANVGGEGSVSVREVYDRDGPGVVSVDVSSVESGAGGGSGFVIDEAGHVVTNQHVVDGADNVSVRFASGASEQARVVGEDPSTDLAVLKVEDPPQALTPLTLGNSEAVQVGDPVIAIGNPLNVGTSVTTGIVSGLDRPIEAPNGYTISGAVQTDAAINPGNSGGPLLDARGTVIGVNSQIISDTGSFQGVGFAVPIDTVKNVVTQLIETGEAEHGYLGVRMFQVGVQELSAYSGRSAEEFASEYGLPESGAIVTETTPGAPAGEAGIRGAGDRVEEIAGLPVPVGDVITEVEGETVSSPDDVSAVVNSLQPGDAVNLTVVTPGEEARAVEVRLGEQPDEPQPEEQVAPDEVP